MTIERGGVMKDEEACSARLENQSDYEDHQTQQPKQRARVVLQEGAHGAHPPAEGSLATERAQFLTEEVLVGVEQLLPLRPVTGEGLALAGQQCLKCGDDNLLASQRHHQVAGLPRFTEQRREVL